MSNRKRGAAANVSADVEPPKPSVTIRSYGGGLLINAEQITDTLWIGEASGGWGITIGFTGDVHSSHLRPWEMRHIIDYLTNVEQRQFKKRQANK